MTTLLSTLWLESSLVPEAEKGQLTSQLPRSFYEVSFYEGWKGKGFYQLPSPYGEILNRYNHRGEGGVGVWLWRH